MKALFVLPLMGPGLCSPITISSISPTNATAGGAALSLTVARSNSAKSATVLWNGSSRSAIRATS
jgi:hypothetical protein